MEDGRVVRKELAERLGESTRLEVGVRLLGGEGDWLNRCSFALAGGISSGGGRLLALRKVSHQGLSILLELSLHLLHLLGCRRVLVVTV